MNYLYDHVHKVHQQNMPHSCDLCHEKFSDKSSLVKHALTSCPGKPLNSTENAEMVMSTKVIRLSGAGIISITILMNCPWLYRTILTINFTSTFHDLTFY